MRDAIENIEEFTDPVNYDIEEGDVTRRRAMFYADIARQTGGPVLEIGCGSGLATIPIAEQGFQCCGVDLSRPMLDHARLKSQQQGLDIRWVEADGRYFELGQQFAFIFMTGNAFQAFLRRPDQEALLACVRRHLAPAGVFAFETRNPSGHDLTARLDEEFWNRYVNAQGQWVTVSGTQVYDPIQQVMHWTTYRRWTVERQAYVKVTKIDCRFTYPQELEALLHYNGFNIVQQYGNWDKQALAETSLTMINLCQVSI